MDIVVAVGLVFVVIWVGICAIAMIFQRRIMKIEAKIDTLQNKLDAIMKILIEIKNR